jgi:site-specific DNA recombinase
MTTKAAIYARKSTEQTGVAEEARSTTRQIEGARQWLEARGWRCAAVYEDDGVSGALFANRADWSRMMKDAAAGAFEALVLFDLDRFGRNAAKTMVALNTLTDLGISIWDYSTGRQIELESFEGETLTFLRARFAQNERDQARKRTREAMYRKFEQGDVVGCKIFGYDNVEIAKGQKRRRVNEAEATIVREIYERYARGQGGRSIAWALNARGVATPRAQRGRPNGWDPSTIRAILARPLYRGEDVYGKAPKRYGRELPKARAHRERGQVRQPATSWLRRAAPELRIVSAELAAAVDALRADRNEKYLRATDGRVITHRGSTGLGRYLLSGLLRCPCGAGFEALKTPNRTHRKGFVYVCAARRRKGPSVCRYDLVFPIAETDAAILDVIESTVLSPGFIERVLETAMLSAPDPDRTALEDERARLAREIENLTTAIAAGGDIPALAEALKDRDARLRRIDAQLVPREAPDRVALRAALEQRAAEWRETLRANPVQGRMVLETLMGPLEVSRPMPAQAAEWIYRNDPEWCAEVKPEALLAGTDAVRLVASPAGTAAQWNVEFRKLFRAA